MVAFIHVTTKYITSPWPTSDLRLDGVKRLNEHTLIETLRVPGNPSNLKEGE